MAILTVFQNILGDRITKRSNAKHSFDRNSSVSLFDPIILVLWGQSDGIIYHSDDFPLTSLQYVYLVFIVDFFEDLLF